MIVNSSVGNKRKRSVGEKINVFTQPFECILCPDRLFSFIIIYCQASILTCLLCGKWGKHQNWVVNFEPWNGWVWLQFLKVSDRFHRYHHQFLLAFMTRLNSTIFRKWVLLCLIYAFWTWHFQLYFLWTKKKAGPRDKYVIDK